MGFTELFASYFPGYAKFRSVTMILVILELVIPLIGILWLYQFIYKDNLSLSGDYMVLKNSYSKKRVFYGISCIFFLILLLLSFKPDLFFLPLKMRITL